MRLTPGRPPKPFQPRTPMKATDSATQMLSPIETKVAGVFDRGGKAIQKGVSKATERVKKYFRKEPPAPQISQLHAGLGGAGIGAIGLGTAGSLRAEPGDRFDAFQRNALLGAGFGAGAGMIAQGTANSLLSQRHTNKLLEAARAKTASQRYA